MRPIFINQFYFCDDIQVREWYTPGDDEPKVRARGVAC